MKFRKKTMATLFAAILIAMMGVMPALATTATVTLTVDVVPIISISASPTSVDFGTPRPNTAVGPITVTITNTGDVAVTVAATVSGTFYIANLAIADSGYTSIAYGSTGNADLTLTIPSGTPAGVETGSILFTAS